MMRALFACLTEDLRATMHMMNDYEDRELRFATTKKHWTCTSPSITGLATLIDVEKYSSGATDILKGHAVPELLHGGRRHWPSTQPEQ